MSRGGTALTRATPRLAPGPHNGSATLPGLEGIALLDACAGDHDRASTGARLAAVRRLLDDVKLRDRGVFAQRVSTVFQLPAG